MPGLMEKAIANEFGTGAQAGTKPPHACSSKEPLHLGEYEADIIHGFDKERYDKIIENGVKVEKIEPQDYDLVASLIENIEATIDIDVYKENKFLYKHAITKRLRCLMLQLSDAPDRAELIACARIFDHPYQEY
jgi:hypothetical protein